VVFGGYGTFGGQVSRALSQAGLKVTIAGRHAARARSFADRLGEGHAVVRADVNDPPECAIAVSRARVVVNCTGPFSSANFALPIACLEGGAHYLDIAEDRGWCARLRSLDSRFRERGLTAAFGCSSVPGISGALALAAHEKTPEVERARVSLFIGNRNPKGKGAVRAAAAQLGREIPAPQGVLRGFRGGEMVSLPAPFGRREVYDFDSPDYDLLPDLVGAREVRVKVGFESRLATRLWRLLSLFGAGLGTRLAPALAAAGSLFSWYGCSGGAVQVELFGRDGARQRASLSTAEDGQRMVALPAALVAQGLYQGRIHAPGVVTACQALGGRPLLSQLVAAGYVLREDSSEPEVHSK